MEEASNMKYDLNQCGTKISPVNAFPDLGAIDSWQKLQKSRKHSLKNGEMTPRKIMLYLILMFSKDSFLLDPKNKEDYETRARKAMKLAGFLYNNSQKDDYTKAITDVTIRLQDDLVHACFFDFLIMQGDRLWAKIRTLDYQIWATLQRISTPVDKDLADDKAIKANETKNKFFDQIDSMSEKLENYLHEFYLNDDELKNMAHRDTELTKRTMKSRIEGWAHQPKARV